MKIFKKVISAFLASVMCIPTGILNLAYAAETDNGSYTVALSETENGIMQFSQDCMDAFTASQDGYHMVRINDDGEAEQIENDGSIWAFCEDDIVEVELIPDEGYEVASLAVKDAETGREMAHEDTTDNVFSFTMPAKNITINAEFKEADGNDDTEAEDGITDNDIIAENEYGQTVYRRPELTDDDAATLQDEIDQLPAPEELNEYKFDDEKLSLLEEEADGLADTYFNKLTDEQRAQVDASLLFSSLLTAKTDYFGDETEVDMTDDEIEAFQERIDNIKDIKDISGITDIEEDEDLGYILVYEYGSGNQESLIPNKEQDELFLEVLDMTQTVNTMSEETVEKIDMQPLADAYQFFTLGYTESVNDGIMTLAEGGDDNKKGLYWHNLERTYHASLFAGAYGADPSTNPEGLKAGMFYCGTPSRNAQSYSKNATPFDEANVTEIVKQPSMGVAESDRENWIRAVLYFGYQGDGCFTPGVGIYSSEVAGMLSEPQVDSLHLGPGLTDVTGIEVSMYMVTHFALGYANIGDTGQVGLEYHPETIEWARLCYQHAEEVPENFKVYKINWGSKWQEIFYFAMDDPTPVPKPKEPFNLWLFKLNNQLGTESKIATLAGAEFTITYYPAEEDADGSTIIASLLHSYEALAQSGKSPAATFTFETKMIKPSIDPAGTEKFRNVASVLARTADGTGRPVAGIETGPINPLDAEGWKNQFLTSNLEEYQKYYGGAGTYHIRETRAPQGYDLSGTMTVPKGGDDQYVTTNLQKGIVIALAYTWNGNDYDAKYMLNGHPIASDASVNIKTTNPKTQEEETTTVQLGNNAMVTVEDNPEILDVRTHAKSVDTGTQWVDPDSSNIYLEDEIIVETLPDIEARYIVDTRLYDLDTHKFISFNDGYGAVNADAQNGGSKVPAQYRTPAGRLPDGFMATIGANGGDAQNGIITNIFNTKTSIETQETYTIKVRAAIDGAQNNVSGENGGLRGHTLVFMTVLTILNGVDGDILIQQNPSSGTLIYQYPTTRIDNDAIKEDGKQKNEIQTMMETVSEMIYLSDSNTSIISDQTKRKGNLDESIIYAGMYLDETYKSGGGAIKQTLTDTVHYENLQPNRTYYVKGYLIDRETGNPAVDANGTPVQNTENTIKQQSSSTGEGDWNIKYSFDATGCGNHIYVSYVEVYLADELVLEYKNRNDWRESFYIPEITTKMWDDKTGVDVTYAEETVKVHDTITYRKLMPGTRYKVETRLVNMETGETLLDVNGNPVTKETIKTVAVADGEMTVDIEFPAVIRDDKGDIVKSLAGTIFVCYEKIYIEQGQEGSGKWVLVANHEEFWDKNQRIYMPYIDTTALDQKTQEHISYAEKNMKIYDTVHYEAVRPEYTYKLVSELRDTATGEIVVDNAGKKQVITTYFKADFDLQDNQYLTYGDVIPENHEGSGITFDVDAEFFAGRTLVVYERMYLENDYGTGSHLVAEHQVLLDEDQTIHVPKVWTSAIDSDTFTKTSFADGSTTIIDTFSYENLIPGFTYELKGYVLDRNQSITTGTNVTAAGTDGRLAQNSVVFTPESSAGAVRLSFEVDTRKFGTKDYNGMVFVVYEELYVIQRYDGDDARSIVASHTDIADLNQTIYVPRITTNLTDKKTGTKIADADGTMQLTDTVNYYRFQPNTEYVIKGKLLDMKTGNVLTDGRGSRVEKTVSVMSSDTGTGEWQIDYGFDGTGLAGKIVVAYADVYIRNGERNDILSHVASHNDFWDESQRVYIPLISTVATDQKTNSHITYAEENVWVTDRISYSFLKPNTEYRLVSKLVDKDTGEVVVDDKGMEQVITSDFVTTPNESQEKYNQIISNPLTDSSDTGIGYSYGYIIPADGTVLPDGTPYRGVVFTFDAHTFEGRTLVIYEELQIRTADSAYMTVARHMDINDENQTVHIPKIRTNAVDSETLTHSSKMDGSMTIIDTVKYENLIPGFTYVLEGYLMDKPRDDTKGYGKIKDKDGNYITNRIEFTPDRPSGEVKLSLSGNASEFQTDEGAFSSETLVVFERLYLKDSKDASDELLIVASHEDINDENQTIYCPRISTKVVAYDLGEESKDGDADHVIGYTAYECGYCKTRFQTEKEAKTHIDSSIKCKNMGAKVNSVTEATIYDRVYYENLIPDRTYSMVGHLIDTKTGKAVLINQRAVQSEEKYFTPGAANGEVDVVFHVTGLDLVGGRYVVYEELFLDGVSIAEHKDFYDENQTFYVPSMVTSAYDINTRTNIAKNDTKSTIIDEVQLSGLKEGQNYYLSSILMDKETGSQFIDGSGRTVSAVAWRKKGGSVWNYYEDGKKIL